jgi:hypothetical protein
MCGDLAHEQISGQLKGTRTGDIIYHSILADVAVSICSSLEATFYQYLMNKDI